MLLYKCKLTDDDLFTDAKPVGFISKENGFIIVKGQHTSRSNTLDESKFGFNASAEEAQEQNEDGAESGIDMEMDNGFVRFDAGCSKGDFKLMTKEYVAKLKQKIPEEKMKEFQTNMMAAASWAIKNFSKVEYVYASKSQEDGGMPIFMIYEIREGDGDQDHPYYYFFEEGVTTMKL